GSTSMTVPNASLRAPAGTTPGHVANAGTRMPPSKPDAFASRNGTAPARAQFGPYIRYESPSPRFSYELSQHSATQLLSGALRSRRKPSGPLSDMKKMNVSSSSPIDSRYATKRPTYSSRSLTIAA